MKFRTILMAMMATVFSFVACNNEEDPNDLPASIKVAPAELSFESGEDTKPVEVTSSRNWIAKSNAEWLTVSTASGDAAIAAQSVGISVMANTGYNREAQVTFSIGLAKFPVTVKQAGPKGEYIVKKGSGTKEDPYTVAGVVEFVNTLAADVESSQKVYVSGKISSVSTTFEASGTYGNASFDMVDEDGSDVVFKAFQTYYLGNRKWKSGDTDVKAGDEVILYGKVVNYKGNTPETVGKGASYIYSLNGVTDGGSGGGDDDYKNAEAKTVAEFIAAANTTTYYKLTGKVSGSINTTYGNYDLKDDTGTIYVYGTKNWSEWKDKVKSGVTVTLAAVYKEYNGKAEAVDAYILSVDGSGSGGGDDYQNAEAKTVAEFIAAANTTTYYKLTGKVSGSINTTYGNYDLVDDTGTIYVYGTKNWSEWKDKVKSGVTVTLAGVYKEYNGKAEAVDVYILSVDGSGTTEEYGSEAGAGTASDPYNVSKAHALAKALDENGEVKNVYVKGKISALGEFSAQYGNYGYSLVDEGHTGTLSVYRGFSFDGEKFTAASDLAVGDEVVLLGTLVNYKGNTPQVTSGSKLITLNGQSGSGPKFGVANKAISVAATATSATISVTGNVAWTATSTDATVAPASGEGAGDITVTFEANTSTEAAKTYKVVVATEADVTTKSIEVVITQSKVSTGGESVEIVLNNTSTWTEDTDATYKGGFATTKEGVKVGFYQHSSSTKPVTPDQYSVRIYKSSVFIVNAPEGKKVKSIVFTANNYDNGKYCKPLTVLEGGSGTIAADTATMTIGPWTGEATKVVFQAAEAQTRVEKVVIELE